jgi:two-component system, OmpR family, sensor histidine kinase KdpD
VRNLLNNAAKYTPPGSHVVVSARSEGTVVEVRVTDDGPGIPPASLERIFELFYRDPMSSRSVAGSGIGLFVCASLAEAMGGRIWARRLPEGGSEIGFTLRAIEPDAADSKVPREEVKPAVAIVEIRRPAGEAAPGAPGAGPALREGQTPAG